MSHLFKILPRLKVETLTVLSGGDVADVYFSVGSLIREGDGWGTLWYICHLEEMLAIPLALEEFMGESWMRDALTSGRLFGGASGVMYGRKPQPETWMRDLRLRDGKARREAGDLENAEILVVVKRAEGVDYDMRFSLGLWQRRARGFQRMDLLSGLTEVRCLKLSAFV